MERLAIYRWIVRGSILVFLMLLVGGGCASLGVMVSRKIYPNLPTPEDYEPPATYVAFPPSTQLSAVIGGQGGGIGCSIPPYIKPLFFNDIGDSSDVNLRFRQACASHDLCYRHGWATYGYTQVDCDFALQQSAFRICRLVFKDRKTAEEKARRECKSGEREAPPAPPSLSSADATEACRDQAKMVLLGVRIGGGGSFKTGSASTYYEFDPMPDHADNYGVVRWLGQSQSDGAPLRGHFVHLLLQHGRTSWRLLPGGSQGEYAAEIASIPTPPQVVSDSREERLTLIARRTQISTDAKLWNLDLSNDGALEHNKYVGEPAPFNTNSTVVWPARTESHRRIAYWRRYSSTVAACDATDSGKCEHWTVSKGPGPTPVDTYRTLQHPPLRGRFLGGPCHFYAILRRGGDPRQATSDAGKKGIGFSKSSGVVLTNDPDEDATRCPARYLTAMLQAPESIEPLGLIEFPEKDALIGFASENPRLKNAPMSATVFRFDPDAITHSTKIRFLDPHTRVPLDSQWIARTISVLRADTLRDGRTHIVFSRLRESAADEEDGRFAISEDDHSGPIHLDALDYALPENACKENECVLESQAGLTCQLDAPIAKDARERWANGATIPGSFSVETGIAATTGIRRLQIAFFYRGLTKWAFLAETHPHSEHAVESVPPKWLTESPDVKDIFCGAYGGRSASTAQVDADPGFPSPEFGMLAPS